MSRRLRRLLLVMGLAGFVCAGCQRQGENPAPAAPTSSSGGYGYGDYGYGDYGYGGAEITFLENAPSNAAPADDIGLLDLKLISPDGLEHMVREFLGERGLVLVVTRGATEPICPYCSTQTAQYIRDYDQFQQQGINVVLVYPVATRQQEDRLQPFLADAKGRLQDPQRPVPFPVLFDVELSAVTQLGIRKDLSKPATYILDGTGQVRYAYVGAHLADRPSTAAVLREIDKLLGPADRTSSPASAGAAPGETAIPPNQGAASESPAEAAGTRT